MQQSLCNGKLRVRNGLFYGDLHPVVAHACPASAQIAHCVCLFFQHLTWRHPDLPPLKHDFGIIYMV